MTDTLEEIRQEIASRPPNWIDLANQEILDLQEAAKADPKSFFGNRVRGMGDGLSRVKALLYATQNIDQALKQLQRVL